MLSRAKRPGRHKLGPPDKASATTRSAVSKKKVTAPQASARLNHSGQAFKTFFKKVAREARSP